jgi:hypothetical protein
MTSSSKSPDHCAIYAGDPAAAADTASGRIGEFVKDHLGAGVQDAAARWRRRVHDGSETGR